MKPATLELRVDGRHRKGRNEIPRPPSGHLFEAVLDRLGDAGVVELAALTGCYTMLAFTMNAVGTG
jgi:hypothetical protein